MLLRAWVPASLAALCCACGGAIPSQTTDTRGRPADVALVRLFSAAGTELTLHTGLVDDDSMHVEVRLYAANGGRLGEIVGGVQLALQFTPNSLATSSPVPGEPLQRIVKPTSASGTTGSQTVALHFPEDGTNKSFGPFHVQVQPSAHLGVSEMRLFDDHGAEMTQHVPLNSNQTAHLEVRLYDAQGMQLTNPNVAITFRFDPTTLAQTDSVPQKPLFKDVTPTALAGTHGSLLIDVLFLADSVTKTYGPIEVLIH